jgi:hypothetical protein
VLLRFIIGALIMLAGPLANAARAQDQPRFAVELSGGWVGFADDGIVGEGLVGGAARWYLLPRIAVGPEVAYLSGNNHSHLIVTGNVTWDLLARRAVTPFLVAGGGLFQTRESFFTGTFTSSEGAFTAGGGIKAAVAKTVSVGLDARVGWETHVRVGGLVEWRLGR